MAMNMNYPDRVIVLCRMLFVRRPGSVFRPPWIGTPILLGGTDPSEWPLQPIELVDGVPFLISRMYMINGLPEPDELYLRYCKKNCDWSSFRYRIKTKKPEKEALKELLASPKWKRPLTEEEKKFLA